MMIPKPAPRQTEWPEQVRKIFHSFSYVGFAMAVQQNKKSVARRGNRRAHDFLTNPPTAIEATTGEVHRRHHISPSGFYRGKKVIATKADE